MNLLDLLALRVAGAPGPTTIRRTGCAHGFGITGRPAAARVPDAPASRPTQQRAFLLAAIRAARGGRAAARAAGRAGGSTGPLGTRSSRFAFLEYYFFYAYNDFERYQTAIFDNEHEGDDEGCCLVFDRAVSTSRPRAACRR